MGWTTSLLEGVAELLATEGVGVWRPDGPPYTTVETGIVIAAMPPDPDRIIVLNAYPIAEHVDQADVTIGVQVRTRGTTDPRVVQNLDDAVFEALHGLSQIDLGGVSVVQMYRQSSAALGRDGADRWERSSNYYVDAMHPTVHRPF